jgi:hypothetical protein
MPISRKNKFWRAPVVIVRETMTKEEANAALAIDTSNKWWRALMSILHEYREEAMRRSAQHVSQNNTLGAAGAVGASEIITTLIEDLETTRADALKKASQ